MRAVAVIISEQKYIQFSGDIFQCQEDKQFFFFISGLGKIHRAVVQWWAGKQKQTHQSRSLSHPSHLTLHLTLSLVSGLQQIASSQLWFPTVLLIWIALKAQLGIVATGRELLILQIVIFFFFVCLFVSLRAFDQKSCCIKIQLNQSMYVLLGRAFLRILPDQGQELILEINLNHLLILAFDICLKTGVYILVKVYSHFTFHMT